MKELNTKEVFEQVLLKYLKSGKHIDSLTVEAYRKLAKQPTFKKKVFDQYVYALRNNLMYGPRIPGAELDKLKHLLAPSAEPVTRVVPVNSGKKLFKIQRVAEELKLRPSLSQSELETTLGFTMDPSTYRKAVRRAFKAKNTVKKKEPGTKVVFTCTLPEKAGSLLRGPMAEFIKKIAEDSGIAYEYLETSFPVKTMMVVKKV